MLIDRQSSQTRVVVIARFSSFARSFASRSDSWINNVRVVVLSRRFIASTMLFVSASRASLSTSISLVVSLTDMQLIQSFEFAVFATIFFSSFMFSSTTFAFVTSITNISFASSLAFQVLSIVVAQQAIRKSYDSSATHKTNDWYMIKLIEQLVWCARCVRRLIVNVEHVYRVSTRQMIKCQHFFVKKHLCISNSLLSKQF